jgi:hypothetical protein
VTRGGHAPRVAIVCADRGIPWLGRGGASAHLRGIAAGYAQAGAVVQAWVRTLLPAGPPALSPPGVRALQGPQDRFAAWVGGRIRRFAPDLVHERHALERGVPRSCPSRWLVEVNAPLAWEGALFRGRTLTARALRAEQDALAEPGWVVAVSPPIARWIERTDVLVVPNGVASLPAPRPRAGDGPFVLGFEGTFKPWHGLEEEAPSLPRLARHPALGGRPLRVELAGEGPRRAATLAALRGHDVRWLGALDAAELAQARARWDAAWIPEAPWPPPGAAALSARLGAPLPERWFAPLKEAEAAAAGLALWKGGALQSPPSPPPTWASIAAALLERAASPALAAGRASWDDAGPR